MNKFAISNRLVSLRGARTRQEVADQIGISARALESYENGERIPRDDVKILLAKFYKKSVENLFFFECVK